MCKWQLNMGNVLIMTFGFFIMMNATNVLQNIAPVIIEDAGFKHLGFYENGLMFCTFAFFVPTSLAAASSLSSLDFLVRISLDVIFDRHSFRARFAWTHTVAIASVLTLTLRLP